MRALARDLVQGLTRSLRTPGFAALVVGTVALAVFATTAAFAVVRSVLLRPLPYAQPERLAMITREGDVGLLDGVDWRAQTKTFDGIGLFLRTWDFDLSGMGDAERIPGMVAEAQLFDVLGVKPIVGHAYTAADDKVGGPQVAVISAGLWRRRFGADPQIVGRVIVLSDRPTTILGVMPQAADFLEDGIELWAPPATAVPTFVSERGTNNFDAIGRLHAGATFDEATAEMLAISKRLEAAYPKTNRNKIVEPIPLQQFMVGNVTKGLWLLFAAVSLVLLIAALNLASLFLARSVVRTPEFALRASIGASRKDLVRQMVCEAVGLALVGGALGALLATLAAGALPEVVRTGLPRAVTPDPWVAVFAMLASLGAGLLVGLVPVFHVLRHDLADPLRGGTKATISAGRHRLLAGLVGAEVALAVALLVSAGLLVRGFERILHVPLGFDPERVATARVVLPETRYATKPVQDRAFMAMVDDLASRPGVESAAYVVTPPLDLRGGIGGRVLIADHPVPKGEETGARWRLVMGDYFRALRLPIVEGRALEKTDVAGGAPVAVVNRAFAQRHWPGESPVGKRIAWRDFGTDGPQWMTVVGLAGDLRTKTLTDPDTPTVYTPYAQREIAWVRWGTLIVRAQGGEASLPALLRAAVRNVDPTVPPDHVEPMAARVATARAPQQASTLALLAFSGAALGLALQGIFGMLAYVVARRRRELGVRMALGATAHDVVRSVVATGLRPSLAGLAIGLALAFASSRLLADLLFEVSPHDPGTFAGVGVFLTVAALAASAVPAWRATRIDPVETLRAE